MKRRRVIVVDDKTEKELMMLCDIALKFAGAHMATIVANIANAIQDNIPDMDDDIEEDCW